MKSPLLERLGTLPTTAVDIACTIGGMWWLYSVVAVYAGLSFTAYLWGGLIAAPATAALVYALFWRPQPSIPENVEGTVTAAVPNWSGPLAAVSALGFAAWHFLDLPFVVAAAIAAGALGVSTWQTRSDVPQLPAVFANRRDLASLAFGIFACAMFVAWVHYPIWDDAYHVNAILATIDNPHLPILSFDGMHGDTTVPIQQLIHRPQTHEIAVATLAVVSQIDPRTLYWLVLPMFSVVLLCFAAWRLLKALDGPSAWLGLLIFLFFTIMWGDGTRTYGGYTIVRLFEGKAFFIAALIPALVFAAGRYSTAPSTRSWILLMLTQCWCAMFSSSALVLAPIAAGLALLVHLRPSRDAVLTFARGLAASAPLLIVIVVMKLEVASVGGLRSDGWIREATTMLGGTTRGPISLSLLAAVPFAQRLAGRPSASFLPRYALVCVLLVFNPITPAVLSEIASLFSWRLYWCVPMPLLAAGSLAMGAVGLATHSQRTGSRWVAAATTVALCTAFGLAGPRTYDRQRMNWQFMEHRVPQKPHLAAVRVVHLTEPTDLVLATPRVAERIAQLPGRPLLLSIREQYLVNLSRHWGEGESLRRMRLMMFAEGSIKRLPKYARSTTDVEMLRVELFPDEVPDPAAELETALQDLAASRVKMLVVPRKFGEEDGEERLEALGFLPIRGSRGYRIYVRETMPVGSPSSDD